MRIEQMPRFCELLEERVIELRQAINEEDRVLMQKEYAWLDEVVEHAIDRIQQPREATP